MNVRLPACDPCRRAKLACDHGQPTCARCRDRGQGDACVYRAKPFKRKKLNNASPSPTRSGHDEPSILPSPPSLTSSQPHRYPNPGFLGSSSHSAIFSHVSSSANPINADSPHDDFIQTPASCSFVNIPKDQAIIEKAIKALSQLDRASISKLKTLVGVWLGKGVNLPLAEPLVARCAQAVHDLAEQSTSHTTDTHDSSAWISQCAERLLRNTRKPIILRRDSSVADFFSQMLGENVRWETLGIFFVAASRAALDVAFFPSLYTSDERRREFVKLLTHIGECCLETCLGLDCLNDLQLVLQYENLVVHSQVYGDQSYHSWRRMGDVASSLFALGYHEKIDQDASQLPEFIVELHKAAFARIYAADKNLAIFLGRPPRIIKAYCNCQLPSNIPGLWSDSTPSRDGDRQHEPDDFENINYTADTRCSAMFASLKEDILALFRDRDPHGQIEKTSTIKSEAEKRWQTLPANFKLETSVKDCRLGPFERDFLVGTRLDYLHTLFLLHLVSLRHISQPDVSLLKIACEMLSHVVEVIILRARLVNSGTCLIWKVAHFGLPAAGIISLALLNPSIGKDTEPLLQSKMLQDLSVLVAEVRMGAVIEVGEPNFALFTRATRTIQRLLDALLAGELPSKLPEAEPIIPQQHENSDFIGDWDPWINADPWEFEIDFWANLAEHPSLQGSEHQTR